MNSVISIPDPRTGSNANFAPHDALSGFLGSGAQNAAALSYMRIG
ncbi:hypothetical protein ACFOLL_09545 [Falsochrobactrum ovis]